MLNGDRSFFDRWLGWDQRLELLDEHGDVIGHDAPDDVIVHFIIIMGEDVALAMITRQGT